MIKCPEKGMLMACIRKQGGTFMASEVLFPPVEFEKSDSEQTLPSRFSRLIDQMGLQDVVRDKLTAVKMHLGLRSAALEQGNIRSGK